MFYFWLIYGLLWIGFIAMLWRINRTDRSQTICFMLFLLLLLCPAGLRLSEKIKPRIIIETKEKIVYVPEIREIIKTKQQIEVFLKKYPKYKKWFR